MKRRHKSEMTRERLLDAVVSLVQEEHIPSYPKVDDITEKAGCSHGSLYTHFEDQGAAVLAAVQRELREIDTTVPDPSENLTKDLTKLAQAYYDHLVESPFLMLVLPQIAQDDDLLAAFKEQQGKTITRLQDLYEHHRESWHGPIRDNTQESIVDLISPIFLGGIFTRVLFSLVDIAKKDLFDADDYVKAFLTGYGNKRIRHQEAARRLIDVLASEAGLEVTVKRRSSESRDRLSD